MESSEWVNLQEGLFSVTDVLTTRAKEQHLLTFSKCQSLSAVNVDVHKLYNGIPSSILVKT